jgi:hypothetical protein
MTNLDLTKNLHWFLNFSHTPVIVTFIKADTAKSTWFDNVNPPRISVNHNLWALSTAR